MKFPKIPIYRPNLQGNEQNYVQECLTTSWISSKGPFIEKFEHKFAEYVGAEHATSVSNGTVALHLALLALEIGVGDEVLVPSLTYIASVNAIKFVGATPVFVDSLLDTWQMDPADIARKITPNSRAIMAVHLYGYPCDMKSITNIAKNFKLALIEDCAEAIGTFFDKKHVGVFGDVATFSFYGNKTITTGEGGMVVASNKKIIDTIYHLKNQGVSQEREYWHDVVGYNYRMTNIQAAIGLAQLERVEKFLTRKRELASLYSKLLSHLGMQLPKRDDGNLSSYWMISILVDSPDMRNELRIFLRTKGIETRPFFAPAHSMPMYKSLDRGDCQRAVFLSERGINLPSYPDLEDHAITEICSFIEEFICYAMQPKNLQRITKSNKLFA